MYRVTVDLLKYPVEMYMTSDICEKSIGNVYFNCLIYLFLLRERGRYDSIIPKLSVRVSDVAESSG